MHQCSSAVHLSVCQVYVLYQTAVSPEACAPAISLLLQLTHAVHPMVLHAVTIHAVQSLASQALSPHCNDFGPPPGV